MDLAFWDSEIVRVRFGQGASVPVERFYQELGCDRSFHRWPYGSLAASAKRFAFDSALCLARNLVSGVWSAQTLVALLLSPHRDSSLLVRWNCFRSCTHAHANAAE